MSETEPPCPNPSRWLGFLKMAVLFHEGTTFPEGDGWDDGHGRNAQGNFKLRAGEDYEGYFGPKYLHITTKEGWDVITLTQNTVSDKWEAAYNDRVIDLLRLVTPNLFQEEGGNPIGINEPVSYEVSFWNKDTTGDRIINEYMDIPECIRVTATSLENAEAAARGLKNIQQLRFIIPRSPAPEANLPLSQGTPDFLRQIWDLATAVTTAEPVLARIACSERNTNTEERLEATNFLKIDGNRWGEDLEMYNAFSHMEGKNKISHMLLEEFVIPMKDSLPTGFKAGIQELKNFHYFGTKENEWQDLLEGLLKQP